MWKSGITFRQRSAGVRSSVSATFAALAASFRCVSGTSFGRAVVPDVCSSKATASGSSRPSKGVSVGTPSIPKVPAGAAASIVSSSTRMPSFRATFAGRRVERRVDHDRVGAEVLEVEGELLRPVGGIEWRRRRGLRQRQKRTGGLGPVLDHERDAAASAQSGRSRALRRLR